MMARYFYAFRWAYGIGATWDDGSWPGELYVNDMAARYDGSRSAVERYAPTAELVRAWRRIGMQLNPVAYMGE